MLPEHVIIGVILVLVFEHFVKLDAVLVVDLVHDFNLLADGVELGPYQHAHAVGPAPILFLLT